jgi:translation elongation factor EF-Ts
MNIVDEISIHKIKPLREQILSSIKDTKKALKSEKIGEETRNYLENYLQNLNSEIRKLGLN